MTSAAAVLRRTAREFATAIPSVDAHAEHSRWKAGIGPFEEPKQIEMILRELAADGDVPDWVRTEVPYPKSGKRCDLVVERSGLSIPIEAKLLRFRLDNGHIDPNMYKSVFSPFPEQGSGSLLTDARKLVDSGFETPCGLLGLYYERDDEPYRQLTADRIAEKFGLDIEYWYGLDVETAAVERFEGLRHPHHQHGAVISWELTD